MKTIILTLILTLAFGGLVTVDAQTSQRASVRVGRQKKLTRSNVTIRFIEMVEDSRCPKGTQCVWAGNARIKVQIRTGRESKTIEMNTNTGPKGETIGRYVVMLESLTPEPAENIRINRNGYTATFSVKIINR